MKPNYLINSFNMNLFITCWVLENNQQKQKSQNEYEYERKKDRETKMLPIILSILFIYLSYPVRAQYRAYTCVQGVY